MFNEVDLVYLQNQEASAVKLGDKFYRANWRVYCLNDREKPETRLEHHSVA